MQIRTPKLFSLLEEAHSFYSKADYLDSDPICIPYRYSRNHDRELVSLVTCLLAYGNVKAIKNKVEQMFVDLSPTPYQDFLENSKAFQKQLKNLGYYRFQTNKDLQLLFLTLAESIRERATKQNHTNSIWEDVFCKKGEEFHPKEALERFQTEILKKASLISPQGARTYGFLFLIGKPTSFSPKKRLSLFLRWMVRKNFPDFGIYSSIHPAQISFPLDVHVKRISKILGLSKKKQMDWPESLALKEMFRAFCPEDPLKYDFVLTRIGMVQKCKAEWVDGICGPCVLREECSIGSATGNRTPVVRMKTLCPNH